VRFDVARTYQRRVEELDPIRLNAIYDEMAEQALAVVRDSSPGGVADDSSDGGAINLIRSADARYVGQGYELNVPLPGGPLDAAALARLRASFDEIYAARYGYANPREPVEVVTWKLSAVGGAPRVALAKQQPRSGEGTRKGVRRAYFPEVPGYLECPIYDRHALPAGITLTGPAIVEERESTTVLPPGVEAVVDEYASLLVGAGR
jgi:N-methylhydantoinase A/oxoprolinase/acetone carboxylase beta subunit